MMTTAAPILAIKTLTLVSLIVAAVAIVAVIILKKRQS
jgi:hypothetical protein